jgi:hypothetical protein
MGDKFIKSCYINNATAAIRRGEFSNYANVAREYKCNRGALFTRIRSLTKSKKNTNSYWYYCLIIKQEELLIY